MGRPSNLQIRVTSDSSQARQDMQGAEQSVMGSLGKLKAAGPAAAAAAALAIGAALVAGIGKALDQSKVVGKLGAQLGATPAEAQRLGKVAGRLYAEGITGDFQTAADAISATMRAGLAPTGTTEAQLQKIATKAQDLASVFDQDLSQATRAVSQLIRTGLVKDSQEGFDVLTKGFQNGANAADDLLDTFIEYSTQFRDMGVSGEMALGLITQALQGGARDADTAADAFKELNLKIKDQSAAEGLKTLGFNAAEMARIFSTGGPEAATALDLILDRLRAVTDPAQRSALAVQLLGTKAEDLSQALFAFDPSTAIAALGEIKGGSDRLGESLRNNAGANLDAFKQAAEQKMVNFISERILPTLLKLYTFFTDRVMPAARELGRVYADYLAPILATLRDKFQEVTQKIQDNEAKWRPLWEIIRDKIIPILSQLVSGALGRLLDIMIRTLDITFAVTDALGKMARQVQSAIDWLSRLKPPGWLSSVTGALGDLVGLSSSFSGGTVSVDTNGTLRRAETFATRAMSTALPARGPRLLTAPTQVFVTIDGQQLQGRITRSITSALQYEGARYQAGGWA